MPGRAGAVTVTLVAAPDLEPCVHYWQAVDHDETLIVCSYCRKTWAFDDDPGDDGNEAA